MAVANLPLTDRFQLTPFEFNEFQYQSFFVIHTDPPIRLYTGATTSILYSDIDRKAVIQNGRVLTINGTLPAIPEGSNYSDFQIVWSDGQLFEIADANGNVSAIASAEGSTITLATDKTVPVGYILAIADTQPYTGNGTTITLGDVSEESRLNISTVPITLSSTDPAITTLAIDALKPKDLIQILYMFKHRDEDQWTGPFPLFEGYYSRASINDTSVILEVETRFSNWNTKKVTRYDRTTGRQIQANDAAFDYVSQTARITEVVFPALLLCAFGGLF